MKRKMKRKRKRKKKRKKGAAMIAIRYISAFLNFDRRKCAPILRSPYSVYHVGSKALAIMLSGKDWVDVAMCLAYSSLPIPPSLN